ncbi:hypothetical protein ACFTWF_23350 [Rhodococcus sp. NPDC056960]
MSPSLAASIQQFKTLCAQALWRLHRMPHLVRGFFADSLVYIRAAA